jgi:hypothetical protein
MPEDQEFKILLQLVVLRTPSTWRALPRLRRQARASSRVGDDTRSRPLWRVPVPGRDHRPCRVAARNRTKPAFPGSSADFECGYRGSGLKLSGLRGIEWNGNGDSAGEASTGALRLSISTGVCCCNFAALRSPPIPDWFTASWTTRCA